MINHITYEEDKICGRQIYPRYELYKQLKKTLKMEAKQARLKQLISLLMPIVSYSYEIQKQLKEDWTDVEKEEATDWEFHILMNTTRMQISLARQISALLGKQQKLVEEILRENNGQAELELDEIQTA